MTAYHSPLDKLPASLKKSLDRWYYFSLISISMTISFLVVMHYYFPHLPELTNTPMTPVEQHNKTPLRQCSIEFFESCAHKQPLVLKQLAAIIAALPEAVVVTKLVVAPHQTFHIEATTHEQAAIGLCLTALRKKGYESASLVSCALAADAKTTSFCIESDPAPAHNK